jgi:hypothetical protein
MEEHSVVYLDPVSCQPLQLGLTDGQYLDILDVAIVIGIFLDIVSVGRKGIGCDGIESSSSTVGDLETGNGDWGNSVRGSKPVACFSATDDVSGLLRGWDYHPLAY